MKQQREDLKPFGLGRLKEMRKIMQSRYWGKGPNASFWDELESILYHKPKSHEWERMDNDEVVLGEVWSQPIGEFHYKHTVHEFTYLYVESQGLVIAEHGHQEPFHDGKQIKKVREWYIFPDGRIELCRRDETHKLVNNYGKPIYVISLKVSSNATT